MKVLRGVCECLSKFVFKQTKENLYNRHKVPKIKNKRKMLLT